MSGIDDGGKASEKTLLDEFAGQIAAAAMTNATGITAEVAEEAGPMVAVVAYKMAKALIAEKRRREGGDTRHDSIR